MSSVSEVLVKRDRLVLAASLSTITLLAWVYTIHLARDMQVMDMTMPAMQTWSLVDFLLMFFMWTVMMVAMMTPSASPMVFLFARLDRQRRERGNTMPITWLFLSGYLVVWAGFSLLATFMQWGLHSAALLSPMMVSTSPILGGLLLVTAGIFQFTPLKHACLAECRSPLGFLMSQWRSGPQGAFIMGLKHGLFCTGCCWALMALLFVAGVMDLLWVAGIALLVLIEKSAPAGHWVGRATGLLLIGWGAWMLAGAAI